MKTTFAFPRLFITNFQFEGIHLQLERERKTGFSRLCHNHKTSVCVLKHKFNFKTVRVSYMITLLSWFTILRVVCLLVKASWLEQCTNKIGWDIPIVHKYRLLSILFVIPILAGTRVTRKWYLKSLTLHNQSKVHWNSQPDVACFSPADFLQVLRGGLLMPKGKLRSKN